MFAFITKIETLDGLFAAARRSSCPECAGVRWEDGKFVPASCLIDDLLMANEFNKQFDKLSKERYKVSIKPKAFKYDTVKAGSKTRLLSQTEKEILSLVTSAEYTVVNK